MVESEKRPARTLKRVHNFNELWARPKPRPSRTRRFNLHLPLNHSCSRSPEMIFLRSLACYIRPEGHRVKVTVIVAVHNGEYHIGRAIRSLLEQSMAKKDYEILVVN